MKNSNNSIVIEIGIVNIPKTKVIMSEIKVQVEEILDIIDKDQYLKTGEIISIGTTTKNKAHENGDFHQAAHIWIYNSKGEVLIQKRSAIKDSHPGLWDISAAGHIGAGESIELGAMRELEEELGVKLYEEDLKNYEKIFEFTVDVEKEMRGKHWHNNEVIGVFLVKLDLPIESYKLQIEEIDEIKFISIEDLENDINNPEEYNKYFPNNVGYYERIISEFKKRGQK